METYEENNRVIKVFTLKRKGETTSIPHELSGVSHLS
jgi:hypothetical protein